MFEHVILIRYALNLAPELIPIRFELFKKLCLPGLAAQTEQDFRVVLMTDTNFPGESREELLAVLPDNRFEIAVCQPPKKTVPAQWIRDYLRLGKRKDRILVTRMDNDDTISVDFVEWVQAKARKHVGEFVVSCRTGYRYAHGEFHLRNYPGNMFLSLMSNQVSIYDYQHTELVQKFQTFYVQDAPYWIHWMHEHAISDPNKKFNGVIRTENPDRSRFKYDLSVFQKEEA